MRAWAKRMIWFGLVNVSIFLNDVGVFLLKPDIPENSKHILATFWILLMVLPIIFMRDDKK